MRILLLGTSLFLASVSFAQTPGDLQAELTKLAADAQSLQHDLPSFTCKETALSQLIKKDKVKQQVQFVADLRVERSKSGVLHEHVDVTELDGKPFSGNRFKSPLIVQGDFDESLVYFLPDMQPCLHFLSSSKGRIDFDSPPGAFERPGCHVIGAPSGFALFDNAGNITHIEHRMPLEFARKSNVAPFTAIDFSATELNGKIFPLSTKAINEDPAGSSTRRFEAVYTGCHLFKTTITLLPGSRPVTEDNPSQPDPHR